MTSKTLAVIATCATALSLPCAARAAAGAGPKATIFAKFDTNKNGVIDGDEVAAVRKAFAEDPKGQFARYDADKDGKLSDAEIAEIKPPGGGGKKGGKSAEKKKSEDK
jgi:Ca2+-binding EF-hand superfamily protein